LNVGLELWPLNLFEAITALDFYRVGQIPGGAGGVSAHSLRSDVEDLEAKENILDQLITNAGGVEYHTV